MADAVYVYGVVVAGGPLELPVGVEGAEVGVEESGGLAALVSSVPDRPMRATRRNLEAHLLDRLVPLALDWRAREELPERVAAKLSFLVERGQVAAFEKRGEELAAECHPRLQLRLDGPLPPHNFVDLALPAGAAA